MPDLQKPLILALSDPTLQSEEAYQWSEVKKLMITSFPRPSLAFFYANCV